MRAQVFAIISSTYVRLLPAIGLFAFSGVQKAPHCHRMTALETQRVQTADEASDSESWMSLPCARSCVSVLCSTLSQQLPRRAQTRASSAPPQHLPSMIQNYMLSIISAIGSSPAALAL